MHQIYAGDGISSISDVSLHSDSSSPFWSTTAVVGGDFDASGKDELVTGMYVGASYKLYSGNGTSSVTGTTLASESAPFYIRALGRGDFDDNGNLDLVTAVERPGTSGDDLEIYVGSGGSDYNDLWLLYSSYFND